MDTSTSFAEQLTGDETLRAAASRDDYDSATAQLGIWLLALRSFFKPHNCPLTETERPALLTRNWHSELHIARQTILNCSQLALDSLHHTEANEAALENEAELDFLAAAEAKTEQSTAPDNFSMAALSESLADARTVCDAMLDAEFVGFHTWASFGRILAREVERTGALQAIARSVRHRENAKLQQPLLALTRNLHVSETLGGDMLRVFSELANLLDRLRVVENFLRLDQPLKQTLPLFTLVHEDARKLLAFVETRAMRVENLDEAVFDALDGTTYAIGMELRKVFAHELAGLSALRQAPAIYARVENAHGLLRDSFQQSTVALAQVFDPTLDGTRLFNQFQTKLDQSLALRADLWALLQLVRRAEKERERYPVARLLERLAEFREGSLRYLMYKDWEACERFIEEVSAARGAVELTPVLHRFAAYFETLHGQINMRAVLADHPFDYSTPEN
ncbi:MAG: hypothetical protein ACR2LC_03390 [Pyrinomonadaceae bacterium]